MPQLAEMNAKLEQTEFVQRYRGMFRRVTRSRRVGFNRIIVRHQDAEATRRNPIEQAIIPPVENAAGMLELMGIGLATHFDQHLGEARVEAHHVARLHRDAIAGHHGFQIVQADQTVLPAEMSVEVDHHASTLNPGFRHLLDAQCTSMRFRDRHVRTRFADRSLDIYPGAIAVIVKRLGQAIAIGIEKLADMGQTVPLG